MPMLRALFVILLALAAGGAAAQTPASPTITRIAIGSCANQERPQPIWDAIHAYRPELFLFAGDNVYGDIRDGRTVTNEDEMLDSLRLAYLRGAAIPGFERLRRTTPHLATWDDHDFGKNDAGVEFRHKKAAQQMFADFWNLPQNDIRRSRDGVYHSQVFGPPGRAVQVILLDTRFFRSALKPTDERNAPGKERYLPDEDPGKTMLGAEQWAWLEKQLGEPADLRIIVSSIQTVADGHGWERWGNFPLERRKLYDLIGSSGADRVVFVSGDRHIGGIYRETSGVPYPVHDLTASGLTQFWSGASEAGPNRIGALYGAVNFGAIDIDWWERKLTFSLRSDNGTVVRSHSVAFDEISRRR